MILRVLKILSQTNRKKYNSHTEYWLNFLENNIMIYIKMNIIFDLNVIIFLNNIS